MLKRRPAPAESSPPSTATAARLPQRTPSRDQDARAGRDPPASVPATALPKRTPRSPDLPAPAVQDPPMLALAKRPVTGASTPLQRLTLPPASNHCIFFFGTFSLTILHLPREEELGGSEQGVLGKGGLKLMGLGSGLCRLSLGFRQCIPGAPLARSGEGTNPPKCAFYQGISGIPRVYPIS